MPKGISTLTGLIVKIDTDYDGTFETTLTIDTDFILEPLNALTEVPAWPYTEIVLVANYAFPTGRRAGAQVTAKFGWPAIPDDVTMANALLAHDLFKSKDAPFGVAGATDFGVLRIKQNSTIMALLEGFRKVSVG